MIVRGEFGLFKTLINNTVVCTLEHNAFGVWR